jgi:hypothetical protein
MFRILVRRRSVVQILAAALCAFGAGACGGNLAGADASATSDAAGSDTTIGTDAPAADGDAASCPRIDDTSPGAACTSRPDGCVAGVSGVGGAFGSVENLTALCARCYGGCSTLYVNFDAQGCATAAVKPGTVDAFPKFTQCVNEGLKSSKYACAASNEAIAPAACGG